MADASEIHHEIETAFHAYNDAFHREDIAGVVKYLSAPYHTTIGGGLPVITETDEGNFQKFERSLAGMKSQGWVRSDAKVIAIWPLSDDHAYLMADIERFRKDGSMLNKGRYVYSFRRGGPSWQMCGVTDVQEPFLGPGEIARG